MSATLITAYGKYKYLSTGYIELPQEDFNTRAEFIEVMMEHIKKTVKDLVLVHPLHVYNHSGTAFSTDMSGQFADPWDSGTCGFVYVTRKSLREHWGVKRITENASVCKHAANLHIEKLVEGLNEDW